MLSLSMISTQIEQQDKSALRASEQHSSPVSGLISMGNAIWPPTLTLFAIDRSILPLYLPYTLTLPVHRNGHKLVGLCILNCTTWWPLLASSPQRLGLSGFCSMA